MKLIDSLNERIKKNDILLENIKEETKLINEITAIYEDLKQCLLRKNSGYKLTNNKEK